MPAPPAKVQEAAAANHGSAAGNKPPAGGNTAASVVAVPAAAEGAGSGSSCELGGHAAAAVAEAKVMQQPLAPVATFAQVGVAADGDMLAEAAGRQAPSTAAAAGACCDGVGGNKTSPWTSGEGVGSGQFSLCLVMQCCCCTSKKVHGRRFSIIHRIIKAADGDYSRARYQCKAQWHSRHTATKHYCPGFSMPAFAVISSWMYVGISGR